MFEVDWTFTGCDAEEQRAVEECWEQEQPTLESKLEELPHEPVEMQIGVIRETDDFGADWWTIHVALHLTDRTLAVERRAHGPRPAMEAAATDLMAEIERIEDEPVVVSLRREGTEAVLSFLKQHYAAGRSDQFFAFLAPLVRTIAPHLRCEIDAIRSEGRQWPEEEVTMDDVLDDVLLRAWQRFDRRPEDLAFELWLLQLADEVLEETTREPAAQSLEESRPVPSTEPHPPARDDSWTEEAGYPETVELGELIPEHPGLDAWDSLDVERKQIGLARLLARLPRQRRQALVLNVADGFSPEEIADFQDRSPDEVRTDIEAARTELWNEFAVEDLLPELEAAFEERGGRDTARRRR